MTDIDTTVADYFELKAARAKPTPDIDSVVNGHRRLTPAIEESNKPQRRGMLAAAAVLLIAGVGGLMWAQGTGDQPAATDQPSQARDPQPRATQLPNPADGESTDPVPSLAAPQATPDQFPVITDRHQGALESTAEWTSRLPPATDPPGAHALVARDNGSSLSDAVALYVYASFDLPAGVERDRVRVAGIDVNVIRASVDGPLLTSVVLPGTPALVVRGLDPIAFLELAGGFPIDGARLDDNGAPTFRVGALPDGYTTIAEPARLALGSIDAGTLGAPSVEDVWRPNIWTSVHNPLIDAAPLGTLERVDINGTPGWVRHDESQSAVYWQVSDTTWASVGAGSDPESGIALARATEFVGEREWVSRYSVAPIDEAHPAPDSEPATTATAPTIPSGQT